MPDQTPASRIGRVVLVGAGPGDPGLITLRGRERIAQADEILYDYLVNPAILAAARPGCELICLGKHGAGKTSAVQQRLWTQDSINARLIESAQNGRNVVRLKSGDPAIFGRLSEECEALATAGIPYEIVPGITAALAAGPYAGVWITNRDTASAVALVTGHEKAGQIGTKLDFAALAAFPGTLVFYMGVTTVRDWSQELIAAAKSPETAVTVVRRCSWPDQSVLRSTLANVAKDLEAAKIRPPVISIVGDVDGAAANWFTDRPLFGKRIVVTRPQGMNDTLSGPLGELGAECFTQPTIRIEDPVDWSPVDAALARLAEFSWLVFSSVNGVERFWNRLREQGYDARRLGGIRIAAIGPATAAALAERQIQADLIPDDYRAEALADALLSQPNGVQRGNRVLLLRASRGREVLAERLTAGGALVEQVVVYQSLDIDTPHPEIVERLAAGEIDWVTVTSSAIARSLVKMFGDDLRQTKLASISPITSATLVELGHKVSAEAGEYTMPGIVAAILRAEDR